MEKHFCCRRKSETPFDPGATRRVHAFLYSPCFSRAQPSAKRDIRLTNGQEIPAARDQWHRMIVEATNATRIQDMTYWSFYLLRRTNPVEAVEVFLFVYSEITVIATVMLQLRAVCSPGSFLFDGGSYFRRRGRIEVLLDYEFIRPEREIV